MVINHEYKCVFVHVPKTAGTSITKSLQRLPGNSKRWVASNTKHETLRDVRARVLRRKSITDRLLERSLDKYSTFAFVRNPWDRMSSLYYYLRRKKSRSEIETVSSFKDFVLQAAEGRKWIANMHSMKQQLQFFTLEDGMVDMDFVGHYEYLDEDIRLLRDYIGCPIEPEVTNSSANYRMDYRLKYDSEMVDIIGQLFREDCSLFGYGFEDPRPKRRFSSRLMIRADHSSAKDRESE